MLNSSELFTNSVADGNRAFQVIYYNIVCDILGHIPEIPTVTGLLTYQYSILMCCKTSEQGFQKVLYANVFALYISIHRGIIVTSRPPTRSSPKFRTPLET